MGFAGVLVVLVTSPATKPTIALPGGGILFWHQAGAIRSLQRHYRLNHCRLVGASAGCLASVLAACDVDMDVAFDSAIRISKDARLWDRRLGLMGIWGGLVRQWLDELLPCDAHATCTGHVHILAIRLLPRPRRHRLSHFATREELIDTCMASCHIPYFLDGSPVSRISGQRGIWIDGSFLAGRGAYARGPDGERRDLALVLDPKDDDKAPRDFLRLRSVDGVREIYDRGTAYAEELIRMEALPEAMALVAKDQKG